jgi:hypothetical protein
VDARHKATAVRLSFSLQLYEGAEDTCTTVGPSLAGLVPATHVFECGSIDGREGVDAHGSSPWAEGPRDKPGQGDLGLYRSRYKQPVSLNRTAVSTRPGTDDEGLLRVHYLIASRH